ncbi:MAG: hypothetical protein NTZ35_05790 [Ignavibacteriales bacterium]|nr:hypothetical protein [Ignavibacteriales bacterium]
MKTLRKILLLWGATLVLLGAGAIAYPQFGGVSVSDFLLPASSSLLGVVSYFVYRRENGNGAKLVFLNFALFFGVNGLSRPLYQLAKTAFFSSSTWSNLYYYQYNLLVYFLLLSLCVIHLVVDYMVAVRPTYAKYVVSLVIVGAVGLVVFHPFFLDAKFLYSVTDYHNFVAVRRSITVLQSQGIANPSSEEIASHAQLAQADIASNGESLKMYQERYVAHLREYLPGNNYVSLLLKPLWLRCSKISLLSVLMLLFCIVHQYFIDSPRGAYMEKIVWCLLPYCGFEALHSYSYTTVTNWDAFDNIVEVGAYLSMAVMWMLLLLFSLRLRFIDTIEGKYYERRLLSDPSRITRWRDALDNWLLKEFMNPRELDRRFLIQRRTED